jgi:hypothetical protein
MLVREPVILEGGTVCVTVEAPLSADPATLAVAAAIRVFPRVPARDAMRLATPLGEGLQRHLGRTPGSDPG